MKATAVYDWYVRNYCPEAIWANGKNDNYSMMLPTPVEKLNLIKYLIICNKQLKSFCAIGQEHTAYNKKNHVNELTYFNICYSSLI